MIFLAWRFDRFATRYRRFCRFSDRLSEQLSKVRLDKMTVEATRYGIQQFKTIEHSMLPRMLAFEKHTASWGGWAASLMPGTQAYSARSQLADCLNKSSRLMMMLTFVNERVTRIIKKAARQAHFVRQSQHASAVYTPQRAPTSGPRQQKSTSMSWLALLGEKHRQRPSSECVPTLNQLSDTQPMRTKSLRR